MKNYSNGFTLTELLVVIIIASILLLMVGFISNIAFSSYGDLRKEDQVFKDLYHGFNLLTYSLRHASSVSINPSYTELVVINTNPTRSLFNRTFKKVGTIFEFIDSKENTIIEGVNNLVFDFRCSQDVSGNWIANSCNANSRIFHVILSGEKDDEAFNLSADVLRRN